MLVLSRRQGQRIVFPKLNITVQVLPSKNATVRLGIEAPADVQVLREELATPEVAKPPRSEDQARHDTRGRLNTLAMALHVAEVQVKAGRTDDATHTLRQAHAILEKLPQTLAGSPEGERPREPVRALLVEDNPNEEMLLASYLRLSGFRVEVVHDGLEAMEFLSSHERPDILLLDMRMPRQDGPATVAAIRGNPAYRGLRIFAVTGSPQTEFDLPVGEAGVDAWFQKPVNPNRLVEAMSAAAFHN